MQHELVEEGCLTLTSWVSVGDTSDAGVSPSAAPAAVRHFCAWLLRLFLAFGWGDDPETPSRARVAVHFFCLER